EIAIGIFPIVVGFFDLWLLITVFHLCEENDFESADRVGTVTINVWLALSLIRCQPARTFAIQVSERFAIASIGYFPQMRLKIASLLKFVIRHGLAIGMLCHITGNVESFALSVHCFPIGCICLGERFPRGCEIVITELLTLGFGIRNFDFEPM